MQFNNSIRQAWENDDNSEARRDRHRPLRQARNFDRQHAIMISPIRAAKKVRFVLPAASDSPDDKVDRRRSALRADASLPLVVLTPPKLSDDCRGSDIACVRSMRRGGPRIESVVQDEKLITHAYGFGGAGWTLAPGATAAALACMDGAMVGHGEFRHKNVAVVGGGAIGMSVALQLTASPNVRRVTVYAERYSNIAACYAGGLVAPVSLGVNVAEEPWLAALANDSFKAWGDMACAHSNRPVAQRGARFMRAYEAPGRIQGMDVYVNAGLMPPPTPTTVQWGLVGPQHTLYRYDTLFMNVGQLLSEWRNEANMHGVRFRTEAIKSLADLDEPIVFNCTGMGAATLAKDRNMVPVLGHLIALVNQPAFSRAQYICGTHVGGQTYYIPKRDDNTRGVIGGTFMEGEGDPSAFREEFTDVWKRARRFFYGRD